MSTIIDDSAVQKTFRNLKRQLTGSQHKRAFLRAARKGGNLLKDQVRAAINDNDTFEHINLIKRNVKVVNSRSRTNPGVNIYIKGPDVPVGQGASRRFWKLSSYQLLVFKGNYQTPRRKGHGDVKGINPENVFEEVASTHGLKAKDIVVRHLLPEIQKEIAKSIVK